MKKIIKKFTTAIVITLICVLSLSTLVFAEGEANTEANEAKDGVLRIEVVYKDPATGSETVLQSGSGFLIGSESTVGEYMITCDHVVRLSEADQATYKEAFGVDANSQLDTSIQVIVKGSVTVGATVVNESSDSDMDFAILKLDQPISEKKTLPLNNSGAEQTTDVYALGFPFVTSIDQDFEKSIAEDVTVTKGSVSNNITSNGYKYIQHSATLASGNSGGPLLDGNGKVVGVNTGFSWEDNSTYFYSLDITEVTEVLDYLNIAYTDETGAVKNGGSGGGNIEPTTENNTGDNPPGDDVDKMPLREALSTAQEVNKAEYTADSYATLETAINNATEILDDESATSEQIQTALDDLSSATSGLVPAVVDKTVLASEIASGEALLEENYDPDSFADFQMALDTAKTINDKADATQEEVDSALDQLKTAREGLVEKKSNTMLFVIIGIIAAVIILIIVIVIVLVSKSKKKVQPEMPKVQPLGGGYGGVGGSPIQQQPRPLPPATPVADASRRAQQQNVYPAPPTIPQVAEGAGETVLLNEGSGETTLLSETNQVMAILVKTKTGEKVTIGKREFKIGKERSKVDYCITNNSVSRIHAIITFENGDYYIKDNNSTNYTYVNGEAIAASQKVKLNNNDRIKFSDEEFQFKLA